MVLQAQASAPQSPKFKMLRFSLPADGVCHLQLDRKPVNAMNTALWKELLQALDFLEEMLFPKFARVLVISSNCRADVFSAGNDLTQLYAPMTTQALFFKFWEVSTQFLSRLYKTRLYTIAAMRGATPAGGFVMSMCCDYRLALQTTRMGLNEVAIGLSVPRYWARLLLLLATNRARGEELLASGDLIPADEAQTLGLVNKIVRSTDAAILHNSALALAEQWAKQKDVYGRVDTKLSVREQFAEDWITYGPDEARKAWKQLSSPGTVAVLGGIMKKLSGKPGAKM